MKARHQKLVIKGTCRNFMTSNYLLGSINSRASTANSNPASTFGQHRRVKDFAKRISNFLQQQTVNMASNDQQVAEQAVGAHGAHGGAEETSMDSDELNRAFTVAERRRNRTYMEYERVQNASKEQLKKELYRERALRVAAESDFKDTDLLYQHLHLKYHHHQHIIAEMKHKIQRLQIENGALKLENEQIEQLKLDAAQMKRVV